MFEVVSNTQKKETSAPKNWPNPTPEDLLAKPLRVINIGKEQDYIFPTNFVKTSKYEWFDFLPRFLMEEFNPKTKVANCYFLLIATLQCIPAITNTEGYPTVLIPLTFVVFVDGLFGAIEDIARHKADKIANSSFVELYNVQNSELVNTKWADLTVGDFVKINSREKIPADIVVISVSEKTSPPQGMCYVETKSLDGETNLKLRQALPGTLALVSEYVTYISKIFIPQIFRYSVELFVCIYHIYCHNALFPIAYNIPASLDTVLN